jgi:uncharacterized membrane-anchored protein
MLKFLQLSSQNSSQHRSVRVSLALISGVIILLLVNWTIFQREELLREGRLVLMELAPVDPRSLMQGDYMALRFKLANDVYSLVSHQNTLIKTDDAKTGEEWHDGLMVVGLNPQGVAEFRRIFEGKLGLASDEVQLRFRVRNHQLKLATNAYFFQEGKAAVFQKAKYGEFRVASNGDMILTQLRDAQFQVL